MTTHVGDRLREERLRIGVSQEDAALLCGVSRAMWGRYERAVSLPGASVLLHLIGHGFDLNYILGGSRTLSDSTLNDEETALLAAFRATDDEGRASALRAVNMERMRTGMVAVVVPTSKPGSKPAGRKDPAR